MIPGGYASLMNSTSISPPVRTYCGSQASAATTTAYTFPSFSIGAASADRLVVVAIRGGVTAAVILNSVTIGGITATRVAGSETANGSLLFYQALVPTGTTASVVATWASNNVGCSADVWTITGLTSTTPIEVPTQVTATTNPATLSFASLVANAIVIVGIKTFGTRTFTWAGTSGVVEDGTEVDFSTNHYCASYASCATIVNGAGTAIATCSSTLVSPALLGLAWR